MLKIHQGQKDQLEKQLVESLFTGESNDRDLEKLKPRGKLTLCETPSDSDNPSIQNKLRLPKSEVAFLRKMAARNGFAINTITSEEEELEALCKGLPVDLAEDMLQFIETALQSDAPDANNS